MNAVDEVVGLVEPERRVRAERQRPLEALRASARGDDACRAEELRRLHGYEADRPGRAEHQHVLASLERRPPGEREPAGEPCDPEPRRDGRIRTLRDVDRERVADRCALGHPTVARAAEPSAEHPDDAAVGRSSHDLAAGDVRQIAGARWRGCRARRRGRSG